MATFGAGIRPELGRQDWSPVARGGEVMGQSMANVGQDIAAGIDRMKKQKEQNKQMESDVKAFQELINNDAFRPALEAAGVKQEALQELEERFLNNPSASLADKHAATNMFGKVIGTALPVGFKAIASMEQNRGKPQPKFVPKDKLPDFIQGARANDLDYTIEGYGPEGGAYITGESPFSGPSTVITGDQSTPFETELGKKAAATYSDWSLGGGRQRSVSNIAKFEGVIDALESGEAETRNIVDFLPVVSDEIRAILKPGSTDVIDRIRGVAFQTLRETLGAQFTEREGQRLVDSYFNPKLNEEMNIARLQDFVDVNKEIINAKDSFVRYAEENGTIRGYKGSQTWNVSDIENKLQAKQQTTFTSVEEAEAAGLPVGTEITINGRKAIIK